jgi:hypothetical protein
MPFETVVTVTQAVRDAAEELVTTSVELMETFIKTFSKVVHENHVILLDKKKTLIRMYGGTLEYDGLASRKMSRNQYKRKLQLCQEVIKVLNKLLPGRSQARGLMKFEMHKALSRMLVMNMCSSLVTESNLIVTCQCSLECLKEAVIILNGAPKGSLEKSIAEEVESKGLIAESELTLMMMRNYIRIGRITI